MKATQWFRFEKPIYLERKRKINKNLVIYLESESAIDEAH